MEKKTTKKTKAKKETLRDRLNSLKAENELLHNIIDTVWSELDLNTVLQRIASLVRQHTEADSCLIYLYDSRKKALSLSTLLSDATEKPEKVVLKLGEGITGWAAANRKTVAIGEKSFEDPRFKYIPELEEDRYEAILSVPMLHKGDLVGVINIMRKEPHMHTPEEIRLIETISREVAGAVVKARMFSDVQSYAERLQALYSVSQSLATESYIDDFLSLLVSVTAELFSSKTCSIMLHDEKENVLRIKAAYSLSKAYLEKSPVPVEKSVAGSVFLTGKPYQVYDLEKSEEYFHREVARQEGLKSLLSVPLIARGKPIGVLNVYTSYPHSFSMEEVRVIQSLANQAAIAIKAFEFEGKANQLEKKLGERKTVEKAKGILMQSYGMTEEEAYAFLRKQSMNLRKSIAEVASAIITFSELKSKKKA